MAGKTPPIILGVALMLLPSISIADVPPPPGERERVFADEVRQAGYACPEVASFRTIDDARADDFAKKGLVPYHVVCTNGLNFLVANPRLRYNRDPNAPAPATPIVTPLK